MKDTDFQNNMTTVEKKMHGLVLKAWCRNF
jgi:hypothetical protein